MAARFVDTGNAPEIFSNGLYRVEPMECVTRFVLFVQRGDILEPAVTIVMPTEAIGPGIEMTLRTLGPRIFVSAAGYTMARLAGLPH